MRHDEEAFEAEVVGESEGIRPELHPAGGVGRIPGRAEGAVVESYAAIPLLEERHLLPPAQVVPALAVSEEDRRPFAVDLVVELDPVDLRKGHPPPPTAGPIWAHYDERCRLQRPGVTRQALKSSPSGSTLRVAEATRGRRY
jgi:hypothetical protein